MASDSQIDANRHNAALSTGPQTPAGKARCADNALQHGLFATRDFVRPDERDDYEHIHDSLRVELAPKTIFQHVHFREIFTAVWRLRRCRLLEASLVDKLSDPALDAMEDDATCRLQAAIDRARRDAHRILARSTAELRRLQTERDFTKMAYLSPDGQGLSSHIRITSALHTHDKVSALRTHQPPAEPTAAPSKPEMTKQTQLPAAKRRFGRRERPGVARRAPVRLALRWKSRRLGA